MRDVLTLLRFYLVGDILLAQDRGELTALSLLDFFCCLRHDRPRPLARYMDLSGLALSMV